MNTKNQSAENQKQKSCLSDKSSFFLKNLQTLIFLLNFSIPYFTKRLNLLKYG